MYKHNNQYAAIRLTVLLQLMLYNCHVSKCAAIACRISLQKVNNNFLRQLIIANENTIYHIP